MALILQETLIDLKDGTNMSWIKGTATDYREALEKLHDFATITTKASTSTPDAGNTGDGNMVGVSATPSSVIENFTVTCTSAGPDATFSVTGSVSGALADATSNLLYSEAEISFIVLDGTVDFTIGDEFTFSVATKTADWTAERYDNTPGSEYELILKGIGYSGLEEIYTGFQTYESGTDYGWRINGFTGYNPGVEFLNQPGAVSGNSSIWDHHFMPTVDVGITYWFFVSPQRIMGIVLSGAVYTSFHSGWINSYASPSQWNYPMMVGSCAYNILPYTSTEDGLRAFWNTTDDDRSITMSILDSTAWRPTNQDYGIIEGCVRLWPHQAARVESFKAQPNGDLPSFNVIVSMYSNGAFSGVYGEIEGVKSVPNLSGSVTPEDIITSGDLKASIVVQNCFRGDELIAFTLQGDN